MFYEVIPKVQPLRWPESSSGVPALRLCDGTRITIPVLSEGNMLVTGTPGYGKTQYTKSYVRAMYRQDPDLYTVFFQIKPDDFTDEFLRPGDKVVSYSPGVCPEENLFQWNFVREIRCCDRSDWDSILKEISTALFSELLQDKRNITWADAARGTFEAAVKTILYCTEENPSNARLIGFMRNTSRIKFLKFLASYGPNRSMLKDNFEFDPEDCDDYKPPRKATDILFFLQNVLGKFGGTFLSGNGDDTIYDYLHGRYGSRLFLIHDFKKRDSSRVFELFFLKYMGSDKISVTSMHRGKMLWVLDEIDKIGSDFGLVPIITLCRQFGLQLLISTQSTESLYAIAPTLHAEHLTNAAMSGFAVQVAFHPGDTHTIQTMQTLFGKKRKQTFAMPLSRYDKPTVSHELLPIVEDTEFASLGIGECYIKIRSSPPERVKIII